MTFDCRKQDRYRAKSFEPSVDLQVALDSVPHQQEPVRQRAQPVGHLQLETTTGSDGT